MDTPSSPPAGPVIPRGLATNVGLIAGALAAIAAGVAAIIEGDHTPETLGALLTAGALLYGVIRGWMDQAAAALARPPASTPIVLPAPAVHELREVTFGGDDDALLDDPLADDVEPPLTPGDLAGRSEGSTSSPAHTDLGEQGPR